MAFFSGLKRALGWADSDGEPTGNSSDARRPSYKEQSDAITTASDAVMQQQPAPSPQQQGVPQSLIDDITGIINQYMGEMGSGDNTEKLDALRQRLKDSEAQRAAQESRANSLSDQVAKLQNTNEQLVIEKKSLDNKLRVMQVKADGKNPTEAVDQLTSEYKQKMEITNQLLNDLRADAARKNQELEKLKAQIATGNPHEAQIKDKDEEIARLKKQLDAVNKQLDEANENLKIADEIEEKLKEVEAFKTKKNKEIADLKVTMENQRNINAKTINEQRDQIMKIEVEKEDLQKKMARMLDDTTALKAKQKRRDVELANRIDDLKRQINIASKKIDSNDHLVSNLNQTISNQEKKIQDLTIERDELKEKVDNATTMLNRLQDETKEKGAQLQQLRTEQGTSAAETQKLQGLLDQAKEQLKERDAHLADALHKLEQSEVQVQKLATQALKQSMQPAPVAEPEPTTAAETAPVEPGAPAEPAALSDVAIDDDLQEAIEHVFDQHPDTSPLDNPPAEPEPAIESQLEAPLDDDIDWVEPETPAPEPATASASEHEPAPEPAPAAAPESEPEFKLEPEPEPKRKASRRRHHDDSQQMSLF